MTQAKRVNTAGIYDRFNGRSPKEIKTPHGASLRHIEADGETKVLFTARATREDVEKYGMTLAEAKAAIKDLGLDDEPAAGEGKPFLDPADVYARWNAPKKPAE